MKNLDKTAETLRNQLDAITKVREGALATSRTLTRHCANAIRAIHRDEKDVVHQELEKAKALKIELQESLKDFPNLYHSGYTQDALKEFGEARFTYALVYDQELPSPEDLNLEPSTYLKGLAEAATELRRSCLDILRHGHSSEVERLLQSMDDIYMILVTMDYPDAVTHGLRRQTDINRSILERTRGDITLSFRQESLEKSIQSMEARLDETQDTMDQLRENGEN